MSLVPMKGKHKTVHPWHDLSFGNAPEEVECYIEVPKGSIMKYEMDKDSGLMRLDRVLYSAVHYPGDYGFIPQTLSEDGDPLDIVVLSNNPVFPGCIVTARPIGVLIMHDDGEQDEKIIAVHSKDPRFDEHLDIEHVNGHVLKEIQHFFDTYKALQTGADVKVAGIRGVDEARKEIQIAIDRYKEKFPES